MRLPAERPEPDFMDSLSLLPLPLADEETSSVPDGASASAAAALMETRAPLRLRRRLKSLHSAIGAKSLNSRMPTKWLRPIGVDMGTQNISTGIMPPMLSRSLTCKTRGAVPGVGSDVAALVHIAKDSWSSSCGMKSLSVMPFTFFPCDMTIAANLGASSMIRSCSSNGTTTSQTRSSKFQSPELSQRNMSASTSLRMSSLKACAEEADSTQIISSSRITIPRMVVIEESEFTKKM
mmetsp:Transcript_101919/g.294918  ORF Transcript_101919/g.294918 Transcript_101919/m.294918 type:complete len:236 (-) Transcript_101919:694-1401(-)